MIVARATFFGEGGDPARFVCGIAVAVLTSLWAPDLPAQENQFLARNEGGLLLDRTAGARATALGGAFTALADDPTAIYGNPGGLGQLRALHVTATRDSVRMDGGWRGDFSVGALAIAGPLWGGVGGISFASLDYGTLDVLNVDGARTGSMVARDLAFAGSYTYVNPQWFNGGGGWSGMALEVVRGVDGETRPGFSIGSVVPVTFQTSIAWSLEHVGPKIHGGILPSVLRTGIAFRDISSALPVLVALDAALPFVTGRFTVCGGAECRVAGPLALRGGYVLRRGDREQHGLNGITAGFGLRFEQFNFDYAYQPFGDLLSTHKVSVTYAASAGEPPVDKRSVPPAKQPLLLMPDNSGTDESGLPDAELDQIPVPVQPSPAPPKPKLAPGVRAPATTPRMPVEMPQTEPSQAALVPGSSTSSLDDGWIGPPPTAIPGLPDESGSIEPPVTPIPGAGKPRPGEVRW